MKAPSIKPGSLRNLYPGLHRGARARIRVQSSLVLRNTMLGLAYIKRVRAHLPAGL